MNGLEINLSQYRDNKSEYFSKRMDDRFAFSNGYDLTMSELENKRFRGDVIHHHNGEEAEADEGKVFLLRRFLLIYLFRSLLFLKTLALILLTKIFPQNTFFICTNLLYSILEVSPFFIIIIVVYNVISIFHYLFQID